MFTLVYVTKLVENDFITNRGETQTRCNEVQAHRQISVKRMESNTFITMMHLYQAKKIDIFCKLHPLKKSRV